MMDCIECFALGMLCGAALATAGCVTAFAMLWINKPRPQPPPEKDSVLG
jgi:hypothetical protein